MLLGHRLNDLAQCQGWKWATHYCTWPGEALAASCQCHHIPAFPVLGNPIVFDIAHLLMHNIIEKFEFISDVRDECLVLVMADAGNILKDDCLS